MTQQDALRTWKVHVSLNELIFASWHFKWKFTFIWHIIQSMV